MQNSQNTPELPASFFLSSALLAWVLGLFWVLKYISRKDSDCGFFFKLSHTAIPVIKSWKIFLSHNKCPQQSQHCYYFPTVFKFWSIDAASCKNQPLNFDQDLVPGLASCMTSLHGWEQNGISRFGPTIRITQCAWNSDWLFMLIDSHWSNFNYERMELPIRQRWFCSVGSPCIAEAIHLSQPSHTVEKWLFCKFGVSAFCLCKVILKTSSVTKRLQCLCCQPTIYHQFVDILPKYDLLFWWLVPEKNRVLLAAFWVAISIFHLGQTEHRSTRSDGPLCAPHHALISFIWCHEFTILQNESSPFCRTEWFHLHVKTAFWVFGLLVKVVDPGLISGSFAPQAQKCRWAGNCKVCNFIF